MDKIVLGVFLVILLVGFWVLERGVVDRNKRRKQIDARLAELGVAYRQRNLTLEESQELSSLYDELEALR